jgi:hypothetical protein
MEDLMTLLRMSIENPCVADAFFHQALGAVELAMLLAPGETDRLTAAWNAWKKSYENFQKLWKKA